MLATLQVVDWLPNDFVRLNNSITVPSWCNPDALESSLKNPLNAHHWVESDVTEVVREFASAVTLRACDAGGAASSIEWAFVLSRNVLDAIVHRDLEALSDDPSSEAYMHATALHVVGEVSDLPVSVLLQGFECAEDRGDGSFVDDDYHIAFQLCDCKCPVFLALHHK